MFCFSALGREREYLSRGTLSCFPQSWADSPVIATACLHDGFAYVSSLVGFPCETVTGLRHPTWCAASSKWASPFFQGSSQIVFL